MFVDQTLVLGATRAAPSTLPSAPASPETRARFYVPALDGLRAVAFLMVWWTHAMTGPDGTFAPPIPFYGGFRLSGAYGVPIFFVLSAFLITRLLLSEKERNGRIDIRAYYVRRCLRIWPLYFLVVALAMAEYFHYFHRLPVGTLVSFLTFSANWYRSFVGEIHSFAAALWSVSVEEQFYVVWPFVIAFCSVRTLRNVSVAMIFVALICRVLVVLAQQRGVFPNKDPYYGMWDATTSHLDSLGLGTLLAIGWDRVPHLAGWRWYAAFAACLGALVYQAQWFPLGFRSTPFGLSLPIGYTIVPFIATALVALALNAKGTFLEFKPVIAFGRITFGMYCFHLLVLAHLPGHSAKRLVASLVITYAIAWLSYHLYEKRFLRLKHPFERVVTRPT